MICKNCGRQYSDFRKKCPHCGYNSEKGGIDINSSFTAKEGMSDQEKWFSFFSIAPKIISLIITIVTAIPGIVFFFMAIFQKSGWSHYNKLYWLFSLIFIFGGVIIALLTYVFLKLSFCYKILHIEYLKKILAKDNEKQTETETKSE
mgnify:CR=1 FL=1